MNRLLVSSILFITLTAHSAEHDFTPTKYACTNIDKKIKNVNDRLRSGYTIREGERLKEELRELKHKRFSCRHAGFSVE